MYGDGVSSRRIVRLSEPIYDGSDRVDIGASLTESYDEGRLTGGTIIVYSFRREADGGWAILDKLPVYHWDALRTQ